MFVISFQADYRCCCCCRLGGNRFRQWVSTAGRQGSRGRDGGRELTGGRGANAQWNTLATVAPPPLPPPPVLQRRFDWKGLKIRVENSTALTWLSIAFTAILLCSKDFIFFIQFYYYYYYHYYFSLLSLRMRSIHPPSAFCYFHLAGWKLLKRFEPFPSFSLATINQ